MFSGPEQGADDSTLLDFYFSGFGQQFLFGVAERRGGGLGMDDLDRLLNLTSRPPSLWLRKQPKNPAVTKGTGGGGGGRIAIESFAVTRVTLTVRAGPVTSLAFVICRRRQQGKLARTHTHTHTHIHIRPPNGRNGGGRQNALG